MKKILISIIALFSVLPLFADETLYLNTGGDALWNQGGAKFAIYYFNSEDDNGWSDLMTVENGNIFKGQIPEDYAYVVFARLSSSATAGDWSKVWNKTEELSLGADNMYTITGWGGETDNGEWSTYTPAPAFITYDTCMFVELNTQDEQAGMHKLPYTYEFPLDFDLEFKQVKRVIKFADGVAVDTTLTWYGSKTQGAYMTRESSSWKLDSTGAYNVLINTGDDYGEYTFSYNAENGHFEVAWPGDPAPIAKIYAKNNWDGEEWTWKEMTKDPESTNYTLDKVVFGGTGFYINDRESGVDALWYDLKTMKYIGGTDSIRVNDIVNLVFYKEDSVLVAERVAPPTSPVSVTVGPSGYATIVTPNNLTVPSGVEVYGYTFDDLSGFMVPGDAITAGEILPSGKGYVVKAAQGSYTFEVASAAAGTTAKFASDLTGWTTDKAASEAGGTVYGLGIVSEKVGFYKFSGNTISAGKAVYVKSN